MKQRKSKKGMRIIKQRTPTGKNVSRYLKQKPDRAICGRCSGKLAGVPRDSPNRVQKMARSARTVSRKFGGVLCHKCVKEVEKYKTRMESGFAVKRDLTLEKFLPSKWYASLPENVKKAAKIEAEAARADVEAQDLSALEVEEADEAPAKEKPTKKTED